MMTRRQRWQEWCNLSTWRIMEFPPPPPRNHSSRRFERFLEPWVVGSEHKFVSLPRGGGRGGVECQLHCVTEDKFTILIYHKRKNLHSGHFVSCIPSESVPILFPCFAFIWFLCQLVESRRTISTTQGAVIRTRVLIVSIYGRQENKDILHFIIIAGEICRVFTDRSKRQLGIHLDSISNSNPHHCMIRAL